MAAFETSLAPVSLSPIVMQAVALGVEQDKITTFLLPVQASNHPIYNPSLDYSVYLSQPFFFVLFQVLILLITVYAVGIEIKFRTADEWLSVAKGNMVTAVLGKLTPLHHYLYSDRMAGKLCDVRHSAYSFSRKLGIDEYADSAFCRGNTGLGIIPVFAISGYLSDHKYCFHGRLFGSYLSGCHFPVPNMYPLGTRCFLSFPCPVISRK